MANVKISDLTAASAVADSNQLEINESGTSKRVTASQIKTYATADTVSASSGGTFSGDVSFGDNVKAKFGNSDLEIYHNGSDSYVDDSGSGGLILRGNAAVTIGKYTGETMGYFEADGAAYLYHNNSIKFQTSSNGITVSSAGDGLRLDRSGYDSYSFRHSTGSGMAIFNNTDSRTEMFFNGAGNVGIGTTSPSSLIHAVGGAGTNIAIQSTAGNHWRLGDAVGSSNGTFVLYDYTNSAARLSVTNSGDFLVGTVNTFDTQDNSNGSVNRLCFIPASSGLHVEANNTAPLSLKRSSGNGTIVAFNRGGSTGVGSISVTTSSTSYNTSSDYRLKENVADITDAITRVKQLAPKRFNFIVDADTIVDGFLAHEVSDIVPEAISGEKDAMRDEEYEVTPAVLDEDGNVVTEAKMGTRSVPDYQGIDQSKLVPLLTAALQEAIAKIETLETENVAIKARLDALEAE